MIVLIITLVLLAAAGLTQPKSVFPVITSLLMIGLSMPFFTMILKAQWAELPARLHILMGTF